MFRILALSSLLLAPLAASAEIFPAEPTGTQITVGSDAACDYATLAAATIANTSIPNIYIKVAKNVAPQQGLLFGRQMTIEGGYDTCSDSTASGRTILNSLGGAGSVFYLARGYSGSTSYVVFLNNLEISGGVGATSPSRGGGLTIEGPLNVYLRNTVIRDNSTPEGGGGIYIKGQLGNAGSNELTQLTLFDNSSIGNNSAKLGGGIACAEKANVRIFDAAVEDNVASEVGGGIHSVGCHMTVYDSTTFNGVVFNTASGILTAGGGIYADSSIVFLRGGREGRARVIGNTADLGGGIYLRNNSQLYAYDSNIILNTGLAGGGVYAENSTTVIARTLAGANCYDEVRCSRLTDNLSTAPGANANAGGGGLFAIGGTTRISGTFIEFNFANGGRGMAVRVLNAAGSNAGADQNGLRILGSVIANNSSGSTTIAGTDSIVEFGSTSGATGFTTFTNNQSATNTIFAPGFSKVRDIYVYGTIFDSTAGATVGTDASTGPVPLGDCNRLHETVSPFAMASGASTTANPGFLDSASRDYSLGSLALVDYCDASLNVLPAALSADGGPRPYDDPGVGALYGNWDLGGLERHPLDLIFRNGFGPNLSP